MFFINSFIGVYINLLLLRCKVIDFQQIIYTELRGMLTYLFLSTFENTFIPNTNIWRA